MKDQYLFDALNEAYRHKQGIINNQASYFYTVSVPVTVKERWFSGLKWVKSRRTEWHNETRFNHEQFNKDLANANQQIQNCQSAINSKISEMQQTLYNLSSTHSSATEQFNPLKSSIKAMQSKCNIFSLDNAALNNTITLLHRDIGNKSAQISQTGVMVSEVFPGQIRQQQTQTARVNAEITKMEHANRELESEIKRLDETLVKTIETIDPSQRAFLLAELFGDVSAAETIALIKHFGFDADQLAYHAVTDNNPGLLELALAHGADCYAWQVEKCNNKTLLQHVIANNNPILAKQMLKDTENSDLNETLLNCLNQNDLNTLESLIRLNTSLCHHSIHGYTLFHHAMVTGKASIAAKIIELDKTALLEKTSFGESPLALAFRAANTEIIKVIAAHYDIAKEAEALIQNDYYDVLGKLLSSGVLPAAVKQNLLAASLTSHKFAATELLLGQGADLQELLLKFVSDSNVEGICAVASYDPSALSQDLLSGFTEHQNYQEISSFFSNLLLPETTDSTIGIVLSAENPLPDQPEG